MIAVALLAFLPRLAVTYATRDAGLFADMFEYDVRARELMEHGTIGDAWRGPGYPAFLALLYALPGPDVPTARLANAVLGSLMAVLTTVLAIFLLDRRAALAAGVIVAVYPGLILSSVYLMPEPLYTCLMLASLIAAGIPSSLRHSLAGAAAGVAALTRSLGMSLVPAIVVGNLLHARRQGNGRRLLLPGILMPALFVISISPWLVHTARVSGGPMLDSSSAFNMLAGNNPRATGRLEIPDLQWMMDTYLSGVPNEAVRNARAMRQSAEWVLANPVAFARLAPIKIGYLWGLEGREHAWAYASSYFGPRSAVTVWTWGVLLLGTFPLLAMGAAAGVCRGGLANQLTGWHLLLVIVTVMALHVISFGESRYHLPLVPLLAILAVRSGPVSPCRAAGCAVILVALATAWVTQAPELLDRLSRLAAPGGWQSGLPY